MLLQSSTSEIKETFLPCATEPKCFANCNVPNKETPHFLTCIKKILPCKPITYLSPTRIMERSLNRQPILVLFHFCSFVFHDRNVFSISIKMKKKSANFFMKTSFIISRDFFHFKTPLEFACTIIRHILPFIITEYTILSLRTKSSWRLGQLSHYLCPQCLVQGRCLIKI